MEAPEQTYVEGGCLYVVATPIGNLADISQRAKGVLAEADVLACEDTRVTGKLLSLLGIEAKKLLSYREENEKRLTPELIEQMQGGASVAIVADAGTPLISDPGFRLVRGAKKAGVCVVPVPGASAFLTALSASGLPSDHFEFVGFLAPKSAARRRFFETHKDSEHTVILYESCHRIEKCLGELLEVLGEERVICVAKELTKKHESLRVGPAGVVIPEQLERSKKGEFVVLIAGKGFEL